MSQSKPITLVATIGSSPAVLTEAVYALHQKKMWPVTEIEIITTNHGAGKIKEGLYGSGGNWINLCRELGIDPFSIKIPTLHELKPVIDESGTPLEDIRNRKEDQVMAAHIQQVIRRHTLNQEKRVFALLSGGRKTMSSHLMSAMQLFSRRDDRLLHILVSEPFEDIREFYFPSKKSRKLQRKTVDGTIIGEYDAKDAQIDLIDIPFIRLRPYLENRISYAKPFDALIAEADEKLLTSESFPVRSLEVAFDGKKSCLYINGREHACKLEPRHLSIMAFLIWMNKKQQAPMDVTWKMVVNDPEYRKALHCFYMHARKKIRRGVFKTIQDSDSKDIINDDPWYDQGYWKLGENYTFNTFSRARSELRNKLRSFLQNAETLSGINDTHLLYFDDSGPAAEKVNRVPVPPENCTITGLHDRDAELLGLDTQGS